MTIRPRALLLAGILVSGSVALGACGQSDGDSSSTTTTTTAVGGKTVEGSKPAVQVPDSPPPSKLETKDITVGTGDEATAGKSVTVQYVGVSYSTKKQFDASWDRGRPFSFKLGAGSVIKGWDQGVAGMKEGGRRELVIPPELGYGEMGSPPKIKPNETLVFVVDLVSVS